MKYKKLNKKAELVIDYNLKVSMKFWTHKSEYMKIEIKIKYETHNEE